MKVSCGKRGGSEGTMEHFNPDLKWYTAISERKRLQPRCPFATAHRCPRFYQSLSLLGKAGNTEIDPEEDKRLLEKWQQSDLWPIVNEQATSIMGPPGEVHIFSGFCPEVTFERFGLFASFLARYADEIDLAVAHATLSKGDAKPDDWRWAWSSVSPLHYSECPLFSLLAHDSSQRSSSPPSEKPQQERVISLKPGIWGMSLNLNALSSRLARWWQRRKRYGM